MNYSDPHYNNNHYFTQSSTPPPPPPPPSHQPLPQPQPPPPLPHIQPPPTSHSFPFYLNNNMGNNSIRTIYTFRACHIFGENITFELELANNKINWRYQSCRRIGSKETQFFKRNISILNFNGCTYKVEFFFDNRLVDFEIMTNYIGPNDQDEEITYHTHNLQSEGEIFHLVGWSGTTLTFRKMDFKQLVVN
ncbi:hypothetical protein ACTFIT_001540 [Dictyostelium discoideum]